MRRSEDFAVRRWLHAGAVSAGVGAALLGFGVVASEMATAAADTGSESTSAGATDAGPSAGGDGGPAAPDVTADADRDSEADDDTDDDDADEEAADEEAADEKAADDEAAEPVAVKPSTQRARVAVDTDVVEDSGELTEDAGTVSGAAVAEQVSPTVLPGRAATQPPYVSGQSAYEKRVAEALAAWTQRNQEWVDSLDVSDERKERLQESFVAMRTTFFNQAPTIAPVQITGVITGAVTGTLGAIDPDGDRLRYVITKAPTTGTVKINADGTYTYTPGDEFDGVDAFHVRAIDLGLHVNLLQLLRPLGSGRATSLINQGAVTFDFDFTTGSQYWTTPRRDALQDAADDLIAYFRVTRPVTLTFEVDGSDNASSSTLASAGSGTISKDPGYWRTVVQNKLLGGEDSNGEEADGSISWNWGKGWEIGDEVPSDKFDFRAVAIHELLHAFGFTSGTEEPGDRDRRHWYILDSFIVTRNGTSPISSDFEWQEEFDGYLEGEDGGLYWGGAHAEDAYGGYVPIFTPDPWDEGSSGAHLDDRTFSGADEKLMNAATSRGPSVRTLSDIELGILSDIGYLVYAKAGTTS